MRSVLLPCFGGELAVERNFCGVSFGGVQNRGTRHLLQHPIAADPGAASLHAQLIEKGSAVTRACADDSWQAASSVRDTFGWEDHLERQLCVAHMLLRF